MIGPAWVANQKLEVEFRCLGKTGGSLQDHEAFVDEVHSAINDLIQQKARQRRHNLYINWTIVRRSAS